MGILSLFSIASYGQVSMDTTQINKLDEVVISDTKFVIKRENSGKVIAVISSEKLQAYQGNSLPNILNSVAGIEINGSKGTDGQNLSYFVRGGRNRQVLVMIDGVQLTDPSQIANDFDLRLIQTEQIEKIEILKGASSSLYGSGAATAVINIILKKPESTPFNLDYSSIIGTNNTQEDNDFDLNYFQNSLLLSGNLPKLDYKLGISNRYSDGISAIKNGVEDDAFDYVSVNFRLGYTFNPNSKFSAYFINDRFKSGFDDAFNYLDADYISRSRQNRFGLNYNLSYKDGSITINSAINENNREISSANSAKFDGKSFVVDAFNRYVFDKTFYTVLGLNFIKNGMQSYSIPFDQNNFVESIDPELAKTTIVDPYANLYYKTDFGFNLNTGLRLNNHSEYESHFVYNVNPSYNITFNKTSLKFLASYSTAFITPSLYQLYEPTYGNQELEPEENRTIEFGSELTLNSNFRFNAVFFNRKETNFIDFIDLGEFVYQYKNVENDFAASGVEVSLNSRILENLNFDANFTYTKVGEDLNLRIPKIKVNSALTYNLNSTTFRLDYQYNDKREDLYFNPDTFEAMSQMLASYSLFNFYVNKMIIKNRMNVFANVYNIFNEDYSELFGYSTKGRNFNFGINITL
ncbi:vitamin B12 transporter [Flavobacteriaceae bacterium MAR_2010_188]|nr:vitamin B12 transporter [Flavobacteriaceae bacterium MAR_2010_188]